MNGWEFWIDVGGTFTDCLAHSPDGRLLTLQSSQLRRHQGNRRARQASQRVVDTARRADPVRFWTGYELRFLDAAGNVVTRPRVESFDNESGDSDFRRALCRIDVDAGLRYELVSDEEAPLLGDSPDPGTGRGMSRSRPSS